MLEQNSRTELIIGKCAMDKLASSRVIVFGVGGVGGYVVEALARCGVGNIDIVDSDKLVLSNINRQIYALHSTIGEDKVDVAKRRILDINPEIKVNVYKTFYTPQTSCEFDFSQYDYVVDAIDTVSGKLEIVQQADKCGIPVISSMGAGNKMFPEKFEVADIYDTSVCPLARVMRQELRKREIKKLKVVYSKEKPVAGYKNADQDEAMQKRVPGSISFVPSVVGLIIAGEVVKDLINYGNKKSSL